jgi:hypothetical protein
MSRRVPTNVPASVRARLLNEARASGDSFDQVLQYFAIERFLYRLSRTEWSERLIVKGATMLRAWDSSLGRATRDIDFLGRVDNSPAAVVEVVRECLTVEYPDDGIVFDRELEAAAINPERDYPGVRVVLRGNLDGATFKLQLDVAIDDAVVPDPAWIDYPTLLDLDAPRILAYQPPTALAEKYETIVRRDVANSRLRDYYDIWLISRSRPVPGVELAAAIAATFAHRGTPLVAGIPPGLSEVFHGNPDARSRWRSFLSTKRVDAPGDLAEVCDAIVAFMTPPAAAVAAGAEFTLIWNPSSGWSA